MDDVLWVGSVTVNGLSLSCFRIICISSPKTRTLFVRYNTNCKWVIFVEIDK